jgi:uncharacterized protein YbgA (DUF1722 family)/uncharacterized protein YbbK (DUF523 family)
LKGKKRPELSCGGTPPSARSASEDQPIHVGISSCLLGQNVRYDGGHKRDRFLTDVCGPFVEWVPVCPEVELGLGIPRETIRLVRKGDEVLLVGERSGTNHTRSMQAWARKRTRELETLDLCGYVLKKNSPSCGMERVRVYGRHGKPAKSGRGVFAEALISHFESLPVEEEGRLNDPDLRENFVERVFAYQRLRNLFAGSWKMRDLVAFHTVHKLQLLAHSPADYRELGRLVAEGKSVPRGELRSRYEAGFMRGLARRATRRRHVNVLQHILGHFRGRVEDAVRGEIHRQIEDYRAGLLPLVVPVTLLAHYVRVAEIPYSQDQLYLQPHPKELMLRNHV